MEFRKEVKFNIVYLGGFSYPKGMAGTKRVQHAIDGMKSFDNVLMRVIVLRQSSQFNLLQGTHDNVKYETVMGDLLRAKLILMAPLFFLKSKSTIKNSFVPGHKNILYVYGPPTFDNLPAIRYARKIGFKVFFDIVEDYELAYGISKSFWHRIKNFHTKQLVDKISSVADGIIVISSHLENKFKKLTSEKIPIYYRSISIDLEKYSNLPQKFGNPLKLFYSGSFGVKDGLPVLLDAFDEIAAKHKNIRLVLTGKGSSEAMDKTFSRIKESPFKDRIEYKGYLDDDDYYHALNSSDIPCMTRIDVGYAHAGFPFKLGEFLATGKPVIASRVSDVARILSDGQEAMFVKPGDSKDIVRAVEFLIYNPEISSAVGMRGRLAAKRFFDYKKQSKGLFDFFANVIA